MGRSWALAASLVVGRCLAWSGSVTLKVAIDRFGAVDDLGGKSGRFTSPASLDCVHRLRRSSDAVLVGVGTVARDDPSLTVRRVACADDRQPLRVVLDPRRRAPADAAVFRDGFRTVVFGRDRETGGGVAAAGCDVEPFGGALVDVVEALERRFAVRHLMVEGGPFTARAFLQAGLVDRAVIVRAPVTFANPVPSGIAANDLRRAGLVFHSRRDVGGDDTHMWTRGPAAPPIWDCLLDGAPVAPAT